VKDIQSKAQKEVLEIFSKDAASKGMSLRKYCKEFGIDYYELTGFPRPNREVPLEKEVANGEEEGPSW
jgi:hypothetical protein